MTLGRARAFASRINLPLWLIFLAGAAFAARYSLRVTEWAVMTDELQHVKLGVSVADTLNPLPRIHGAPIGAYGQLYPLLTAPAYALFDMPTAFRVIHGLNAVIMASTAIPAYMLARRVVDWRPAAWLVAALTVVVPWMAMSNIVMTEVAAYPAFVWAALAIHATVIRQNWRRDLLALVAIFVAVLARTQFLVLAVALPVVVVAHETGWALLAPGEGPRGRRLVVALRRAVVQHWLLAAVTAIGLLATVTNVTNRLLGNYSGTVSGDVFPAGTASYMKDLTAVVGVAVGVIPVVLAIGWALSAVLRPSDRRGHAFATLLVVVAAATTVQVSSFLVRFAGVTQDRYEFYVVPLVFVGMAACLLDSRRRWIGVAIATVAFAWVSTKSSFRTDAGRPYFGSPEIFFNNVLHGRSQWLGHFVGKPDLSPRWVILIATLGLGAALVLALVRLRSVRSMHLVIGAAFAAALIFCVSETAYSSKRFAERATTPATLAGRDWVDSRLPPGAHAAMLPGDVNQRPTGEPVFLDGYVQTANWWWVEFWNKRLTRAYQYFGTPPGGTPFEVPPLELDRATGALTPQMSTPYVVVSASDDQMRLRGTTVYHGIPFADLELLKTQTPARADWVTSGLPASGWTRGGKEFRLRLFGGAGYSGHRRVVRITLDSVPEMRDDREVTISGPGRSVRGTVRANTFRTITAPVCMGAGAHTDLVVRVHGKSAVSYVPTGPVGLHVSRITAGPPGPKCTPAT